MSERIRELAKAYLVHERFTRYGEIVEEDLYEFYPDELEKFAELIVRECIDIVSPYAVRMENFDGGHPIADLKKHFGIEV
jgi:hypothetical protein